MYRLSTDNKLYTSNIRILELKPPIMSAPNASRPPGAGAQPRTVIRLPKVRMLSRSPAAASGNRPSGIRLSSGIRITNVTSIKPPDPDALKKQEEDKLRAQLHKEIVSRSRVCAYKRYNCTLPVLQGRTYCMRHILSDPTAPYKRCAHENCSLPAGEADSHGLCFEHALSAMYSRQRAAAPPPPHASTETLLWTLQHYVRPERARTASCASSVSVVSEPAEVDIAPHPPDPFKQIDATAVNAAYSSSIMECGSGSDSDADDISVSGEAGEPPEGEDAPTEMLPLWHAGIFTAEEAVSEAKSALQALRSAYINQMGRLRVLLQMARAQYLKALKAEREQYCSISSQCLGGSLTVRERRMLRKLKAYAGYRRAHGHAAAAKRQLMRKRIKAGDNSKSLNSGARCTFAEGGVRCPNGALPAAKHCLKHILLDRHQVLFQPCGDPRGLSPCREPVPRLPLPSAHCRYHTGPPAYTAFTLKKDNSDDESESDATTVSQLSHVAENIEEITADTSHG